MLLGYLIALFSVLDLLALPVHYFVGGTVVAIIIGVAAQQLLGNLFAGLVLLFARPYVPGERIRIHSGGLGGPHEGVVTGVGLLYTTVRSDQGDINIPNSALLAAQSDPYPKPYPTSSRRSPPTKVVLAVRHLRRVARRGRPVLSSGPRRVRPQGRLRDGPPMRFLIPPSPFRSVLPA